MLADGFDLGTAMSDNAHCLENVMRDTSVRNGRLNDCETQQDGRGGLFQGLFDYCLKTQYEILGRQHHNQNRLLPVLPNVLSPSMPSPRPLA